MTGKPPPTKPEVHYRSAPGAKRQCWNCAMYKNPKAGRGDCTLLRTKVNAQDVCDRWASRAKGWQRIR